MRTPSIVYGGVLSALATALCLIGGMLVGVAAGTLTHDGLPGHLHEPVKIGVAALSALAGVLAGGAAFLAVDLLMDALGWRVGAPGAAEHFTMLTVMFSGDFVAALAAGAVIGLLLDQPAAHSAIESGRA